MSPASGTSARPRTHDRARRTGLGDALAHVVLEGADAAERLADDDDVADLERAGLDQRGRDRAAALVELRLDDRADGRALRVGLELLEVGDEQDHLDELVEAQARLRRDRHERHVAAVLLDDDAGLGQLGLHPIRVRIGLVDLVERDDDRHLGRLGVADRLERLGHDAVVGRHDDDRDVGHARAAGAHRRERLVARGVEEDDALAVVGDLARPDVLGDAAALAGRDLGRPDGVEQARLAVVDVAHDGHDRGPRLEQAGSSSSKRTSLVASAALPSPSPSVAVRAGGRGRLGHVVAELAGDERRRVAVDQLVDRREDAALDELADDVGRVDRQQVGEFLDGDRRGQLDRATLTRVGDLDLRRVECAVSTRRLAGAATAAGAAPTPGHGLLLRSSCSVACPPPTAPRAARAGSGVFSARARAPFVMARSRQAASLQT